MQVRLLAPPRSAHNPITTPQGVVYDEAANAVVDVDPQIATFLQANGWTVLAPVGATSARPSAGFPASGNPIVARPGDFFLDSTLDEFIVFGVDGNWHDRTGAVV